MSDDEAPDGYQHLFNCQQIAISKAALAGVTYERRRTIRHITQYPAALGYKATPCASSTTVYAVCLADGRYVGEFEDIYEGSLAALSLLERKEEE